MVISEASTGSPQEIAPAAASETLRLRALALGQRGDVGGPVEAAARIAGIGAHLHPAAAHIGVERLGAHPQAVAGFLGGDPIN